jgi:transcriptional regulator with GAF, ATPase, and Fis domain
MTYRNLELIDQITSLVVQAIEPHRMLEQILTLAINLARAERGAIFAFPENQEMQLLCSQGADQSMINATRSLYEMIQSGKFAPGEIIYCPDVLFDSRFSSRTAEIFGAIRTFACIPILAKNEESERVSGALYVDSLRNPNLCSSEDLDILKKFTRLIDRAIADNEQIRSMLASAPGSTSASRPGIYPERVPLPAFLEQQRVEAKIREYLVNKSIEDLEKEKLMLLMEKTHGNITRVSEEMGMQRRTIYLKLNKYGIPRTRGKGRPPLMEPAY